MTYKMEGILLLTRIERAETYHDSVSTHSYITNDTLNVFSEKHCT